MRRLVTEPARRTPRDRDKRSYHTLDRGERVPTSDEIARLAKALNLTRQQVDDACRSRDATEHLNDPEWLATQRENGVTAAELADQLGCTLSRMRRILKRHGVATSRPPKYERLYDKEWVVAQMEAGRTQVDIARELGCGKSAVSRAVQRYVGHRHPQLHDPEWLAAHAQAGRSLTQIARIIGCDHKSVGAALDRHGIPRPTPRRPQL